jgi:predicted transposase/invertase (TIGR01784 family)
VLEQHRSIKVLDVSFPNPTQLPDSKEEQITIVDVLCKTDSGEQIIIEMQVTPFRGFMNRIQAYACRAYAGQLQKGSKNEGETYKAKVSYPRLKPVFTIIICDHILFPEKKTDISRTIKFVISKVMSMILQDSIIQ